MENMQRILITGGLGQVGSYLVDRLHEKKEVVILDNYPPQGKMYLKT
ncbi:NAD-dependent epimerase/dehydratase family protein [Methanococcoides methylutens]